MTGRELLDDLAVAVAEARELRYRPRSDRELAAGYLENVLADKEFTEATGRLLARVTGISLAFWMSFEHNYRTGLAAGKKVV